MDPDRCFPLRDSYEVFDQLKATRLSVNGELGYKVVDDPDLYNGFRSDQERVLWTGGAVTKQGEWLIFLANKVGQFGWFSITSFRPEGMNEKDAVVWREGLEELLETFYGFQFRRG